MTTASIDKEWQRFTPNERIARFAVYLSLVCAIVWSWQTVEVIPEFLYDAPAQFVDMFERMVPVDYAFLSGVDSRSDDRNVTYRDLRDTFYLGVCDSFGVNECAKYHTQ